MRRPPPPLGSASAAAALTLSLLALSPLPRITRADQFYVSAFNDLQEDEGAVAWPTPFSTRWDVLDTFGPRYAGWNGGSDSYSGGVGVGEAGGEGGGGIGNGLRYDFHRGMDIRAAVGDPVVASRRAVVDGVGPGNATVILKHWFHYGVFLRFDGPPTRVWYTTYGHLGSVNVTKGQKVEAGDVVGSVGSPPNFGDVPHLHHEVLIGSRCSPLSRKGGCNIEGYEDPAVHPMVLYDRVRPWNTHRLRIRPAVTVTRPVTALRDGVVNVATFTSMLHINRYEFAVMGPGGTERIRHTIDLSLRHGLDHAEAGGGLVVPDASRPHLRPVNLRHLWGIGSEEEEGGGYGDGGDDDRPRSYHWEIDLIVPSAWIGCKRSGETYLIGVMDVWNRETYLPYGRREEAWCAPGASEERHGSL